MGFWLHHQSQPSLLWHLRPKIIFCVFLKTYGHSYVKMLQILFWAHFQKKCTLFDLILSQESLNTDNSTGKCAKSVSPEGRLQTTFFFKYRTNILEDILFSNHRKRRSARVFFLQVEKTWSDSTHQKQYSFIRFCLTTFGLPHMKMLQITF